jgi:superfamily I DNA/RNA helicase
MTTTKEFQCFGPPGCGKTYWATRMVRRAAHQFGDDKVMVASFTKTAAKEIAGRDLGRVRAATLHSHCWHGLDRPVIAETKIKEWNEAYPHLELSGASVDVDGGLSEQVGKTEADEYMAQVQRLRGALVPEEAWPSRVLLDFHELWNDWKAQHDYLDFTDLIETATKQLVAAPGDPRVGIFDEAQDFTPLQLKLVRKWASYMDHIITIGDDDQILYAWAGCTPDAFLSDLIPEERKVVLSQSYRVPRAVQRLAEDWISRVKRRQPKEYRPRDEEGEVTRCYAGIMSQPGTIVDLIEERAASGQSTMLLATCGYMLDGALREMKERGLPFHNPYRETHGGWNPLGARRGTSSAQRLLAFLRGQERLWTHAELAQWIEPLGADGILKRGAKKEIMDLSDSREMVTWDWLAERFHESALNDMYEGDRAWYYQHILGSKVKPFDYLYKVLDAHGTTGLVEPPRVIIGTVHSVKGGEADAVFLAPDLSRRAFQESWEGPRDLRDSIIRTAYVGATRARQSLTLLAPSSGAQHWGWMDQ